MVKSLHDFGGLRLEDLGGKMVNVGCNGSNIFQGNQTNVTLQLRERLFFLQWSSLFCPQNKYGYVHYFRTRFGMLT